MAGWFVKRFEKRPHQRLCVDQRLARAPGRQRSQRPELQHVGFEDQVRMQIDQLNEPRAADGLALYTWHFVADTPIEGDGAEVVSSG